jgi:hypothetical protein
MFSLLVTIRIDGVGERDIRHCGKLVSLIEGRDLLINTKEMHITTWLAPSLEKIHDTVYQ